MTGSDAFDLIRADSACAAVLAVLHGESFDEGWSAASFETTLQTPGSFGFIAVRASDEEPLGFGVFRLGGGEGEVLSIATRAPARGAGVAKALMHAALQEAQRLGTQTFFLEVAVDNLPAIGLYQALGFGETGRRPGYYARANGVPVDALIMALDLSSSCG